MYGSSIIICRYSYNVDHQQNFSLACYLVAIATVKYGVPGITYHITRYVYIYGTLSGNVRTVWVFVRPQRPLLSGQSGTIHMYCYYTVAREIGRWLL